MLFRRIDALLYQAASFIAPWYSRHSRSLLRQQNRDIPMQGGKTRIQSGELSFAVTGQFSQPGIRDLRTTLQVAVRYVQKAQ